MGLTVKGNERLPIAMLPLIKIAKISSGADHLVMLSDKGRVYTCGCGEQGQLGRVAARTADRHNRHGIDHLLNPALVEFKINKKLEFSDVWAGQYCTFAKEYVKGDIYVFGLNNYHQLGKVIIDFFFLFLRGNDDVYFICFVGRFIRSSCLLSSKNINDI